jgi:predicted small secreted protein
MMRKMVTLAFLGCALVALNGCNTVKGLGKDIQSVGDAASRATK